MDASLILASFVSFLASFVLAWLGWVVWRRPASSEGARTASAMFATWWYALAVRSGVEGTVDLMAGLGLPPLSLLVGLQFLNVLSVSMGLAGLLCYLVYLYTGRAVWFWPLMLGYAVYGGILTRAIMHWQPVSVLVTPWEVGLVYSRAASPAVGLVLLCILIGPQLIASVALFALSARLPRSASRVRLVVVASAIFLWFGSTFLASALGVSSHPTWQLVQLFVPLVVGLSVLLVHRPPAFLQRFMPPELPAHPAGPRVHAATARRS